MRKNIENFELTYKQIKACEDIAKAFKKAGKEGVCFLAKCSTICAYQKKAIKHAVPLHKTSDFGETIPFYPITGCINDSGADDMEHFPKGFIDEDENENEE